MFKITQYTTPSVTVEDKSKSVKAGGKQGESGHNNVGAVAKAANAGARFACGRELDSLLSLDDDMPRRKPLYDADTYSGAAVDPYTDVEMQSRRDNYLAPPLVNQCQSSTIALPIQFNKTHRHMDDKVENDREVTLAPPAHPEPRLRRLSQGLVTAVSHVLPARLVGETQDEWHRRVKVVNDNRLHIDNSVAAKRRERSNSSSDYPA